MGYSRLMFVFDEDDHANNLAVTYDNKNIETAVMFGERQMLTEKLNSFCMDWESEGSIGVGFMGDDCVFMTPGWDLFIVEYLKNNKGICYCNDLLQGENIPNNVFMHVDIIKALGFMAPPELKHYFIDNYWRELGSQLGKFEYFGNIVIEHRHWSNEKAEKDATYTEAEDLMGPDRIAWDNYRTSGRVQEDVNKIISQ
jgi:hypothetical protein